MKYGAFMNYFAQCTFSNISKLLLALKTSKSKQGKIIEGRVQCRNIYQTSFSVDKAHDFPNLLFPSFKCNTWFEKY